MKDVILKNLTRNSVNITWNSPDGLYDWLLINCEQVNSSYSRNITVNNSSDSVLISDLTEDTQYEVKVITLRMDTNNNRNLSSTSFVNVFKTLANSLYDDTTWATGSTYSQTDTSLPVSTTTSTSLSSTTTTIKTTTTRILLIN